MNLRSFGAWCVLGETSLNRNCTDSFFFLRKACWIHVYTSLQAVLLLHVFFYIRLQNTRRAPSNVPCTFPQRQTHKHQCIPPHYVKQLLLMPHERLKLSMTQHYPPEGSHQWINAFKNALYTDLEEIRNPLKFQSMWKKFQLNDNQMICSILVNTQPNYVRVWRNQLLQLLLLPDFAWHQQRPSWCIARCTGALAAACSLAWGTEAEMLTFEKHSSCFVYKMASAGISNIPVFFSIFLSMKENVLFF